MPALKEHLRGRLRVNEPMSRHTSWRVGGPADRFYEPADLDDLAAFLAQLAPGEPLYWLGLGSNLLVRDGGVRGTVVATAPALQGYAFPGAGVMRAEAGLACAKVARLSAAERLGGGEFFAGIPGTVGGALAMNAGAFGGETWNIVAAVETLDASGVLRLRPKADYRIAYRQVQGPDGEWFVAARLQLAPDQQGEARSRIRELLGRRASTQPMGQASCGSVFRNPPGDHAARLIEACGLKGLRKGQACISEKHANFIINLGGAAAADIEFLMEHIMQTVRKRHGISLIPEVRVIGEAAGEAH